MGSRSMGRASALLLAVLVFVVVLGAATSVFAASTYFEQTPPAGSISADPLPRISVKVSDPAGISGSPQLKIDGVSKAVKTKWGPGNSYYELYFQTTSALPNGSHTIYASVFTGAGRTSNTWTFSTKVPPTLGPLAPADGSITNLQKPVISAGVSTAPGSTLSAYSMTLDGAAVPVTYSATTKTLSFTPETNLRNDQVHTVSVAATDSAGVGTRVTWSFTVQIYADMSDTAGCSDCHDSYPTAHPMSNCEGCHAATAPFPAYWNMQDPQQYAHSASYLNEIDCVYCHSSIFPSVPRHEDDLKTLHNTTDDMSGCACHVRSLTTEHNRYLDESGNPIACTSCHGSTADPKVLEAIAANQTGCLSCHDNAEHESLHTVSLSAECAACHAGTSLTTIHSAEGYGCATCHKSTNQQVIDAIAGHTVECSACHGPQHALDKNFCYGCHQSTYYSYNGQGVADQNAHLSVTTSTKASTSWPGSGLPAASCANCHNDHSGGLRASGNALCTTCHDAAGTTKPLASSYQGATAYQASGHKTVGGNPNRDVVLRADSDGFAAWEGVSEPTPASPGTPLSTGKLSGLLTKDGSRAITGLSAVNGGYDYQMYRFKVPPAESGSPTLTVRWAGFGEETPNYPVAFKVWNRTLNSGAGGWETLRSAQMANPTSLEFDVAPTAHLDTDGYLYVMASAKNVVDSTLASGPNLIRLNATSFRLDWTTLGYADGFVDWGATASYGTTLGSATRTTGHSVTLSGVAGSTYHYRARSTGRDGDTWSSGDTMIKLGSPTFVNMGDVASDNPVSLTFGWTAPVGAGASTVYRVKLWAPYGTYQYVTAWTPLLSTAISNIPLDFYYWQVEALDLATNVYYLPSATDSFSVYSPSSTCPYLFTWDGDSYEFETDLYGQGKLAIPRATGFAKPEPHEAYVLQSDPAVKDGYLDFRMVEERSEVDYMDEWAVYSADVPEGYDLYTERPAQGGAGYTGVAGEVHTARSDAPAPVTASWVNTGQDIKSLIAASDGQRLLVNPDRNAGFTYQTLEFDLGQIQAAPQAKLLVDAQTMFPNSAEGYARAATFSYTSRLEVQDASGAWTAVPATAVALPRPAEFHRPMAIDITNIWKSDSRKIRLTFLFKTYVDSIRIDTSADVDVNLTKLPLHSAQLRTHGKDETSGEGDFYRYVYGEPNAWEFYFPGDYTKFGDVKSLLATGDDDKYVIFGGGDEVTAQFEKPAAPAAGTSRKYVTLVDGWYKDFKSACDKTVEPLPFHAQSTYPYPSTEAYPTDSVHADYRAEYNTRYESGEPEIVLPPLPDVTTTDDGTHRSLNVDFVSVEKRYTNERYAAEGCALCHNVHGQPDAETGAPTNGAIWARENRLCTGNGEGGCHSGAVTSGGADIGAAFAGSNPLMHHDVDPKDQDATGSKIACSSCHNPHTNTSIRPVSDPDSIGRNEPSYSPYMSPDGKVYVLVGAAHDGVKPVISAVSLDPSADYLSPSVIWTTNEAATSWIDWGTTTSYGSTAGSAAVSTAHSVAFGPLTPGVTYHYRIRTADALGNEQVGSDLTYVPIATPTPAPVVNPLPDSAFDNGAGVSYTFNWTTSTCPDGHAVQYEFVMDNTSYGWQSTATKTLTMYGGTHTWKVRARDAVHTSAVTAYSSDSFVVTDNTAASTCPYLFTWNGSTYDFETDLYGQGKLAIPRATGFAKPEPHEAYVLQSSPEVKEGYLDFRMVEERSETDYMDEWALYSADVPVGYELYTERPAQGGAGYTGVAGEIHTARSDAPSPVTATWVNTGEDIKSLVSATDEQRLLVNEDRNEGFNYQTLELDLGDIQSAPQVKLLVDAQTMFPNNAAGYARAATFSYTSKLEVQDSTGAWVSVPSTAVALPRPAEFHRPMAVDITNIWKSDSRKIRLTFLFKTYVDSIRVDTSADVDVNLTKLPLHAAELRFHGKDGVTSGGDFYSYIYGEPNTWKFYFPGNYTRFGDVKSLLATGDDDKYVIFGGGDEITAQFEQPAPPAAGTSRKYVTLVDGWYKDPKSVCDKTVEPLPFHAQSTYPYSSTESYPTDAEHAAYQAEYNTRYENSCDATQTISANVGIIDQVVAWASGIARDALGLIDSAFDTDSVLVADAGTPKIHYSVDTDKLAVRSTNAAGTQTFASAHSGWESVGATPTPAAPGTAVSASTVSKTANVDSQYWITNLANVDKTKNWQLFEVGFDAATVAGSKNLAASWTGHGEPTAGYPTTLYIWNFSTETWDAKASGVAASDLTFSLDSPVLANSFCLKCHDAAAPAGVTVPSNVPNISAGWTATGNDAHGARAGTRAAYLASGYAKGNPELLCETCHDTHGSSNLYHLKSTINGTSGISVTTGSQAVNACRACHTGTFDQWHQQCVDCHANPDHSGAQPFTANRDCVSCHRHAKTWTHPASCHCGPYPSTFNNF